MDTSCTNNWWNEEVDSVDIIEVLSLVLTSGLIKFNHYGVLDTSSGVREATTIITMLQFHARELLRLDWLHDRLVLPYIFPHEHRLGLVDANLYVRPSISMSASFAC